MNGRPAAKIRPEYIFLGLIILQGGHGYRIYRRFRECFGTLWRISESQAYATLGRLSAKAWIEEAPKADASEYAHQKSSDYHQKQSSEAASRSGYIATSLGRSAFQQWLTQPSASNPRSLRLEFLSRLYFIEKGEGEVRPVLDRDHIISEQRNSIAQDLKHLNMQKLDSAISLQGSMIRRAMDFKIRELQTALAWLDTLD